MRCQAARARIHTWQARAEGAGGQHPPHVAGAGLHMRQRGRQAAQAEAAAAQAAQGDVTSTARATLSHACNQRWHTTHTCSACTHQRMHLLRRSTHSMRAP